MYIDEPGDNTECPMIHFQWSKNSWERVDKIEYCFETICYFIDSKLCWFDGTNDIFSEDNLDLLHKILCAQIYRYVNKYYMISFRRLAFQTFSRNVEVLQVLRVGLWVFISTTIYVCTKTLSFTVVVELNIIILLFSFCFFNWHIYCMRIRNKKLWYGNVKNTRKGFEIESKIHEK